MRTESVEELKANILDALNLRKPPSPPPEDNLYIFILYDITDAQSVISIKDYIHNRYEVNIWLMPDYLSDFEKIKTEESNLLACDAVLIYWKDSSVQWLTETMHRVRKVGKGRRRNPFLEAIFNEGNDSKFDVTAYDLEFEFLSNFEELADFLERAKNNFNKI